ncbi:hypothetical protein B0O99DRAFT_176861 [Bisporella sp. PMI_857]|nr:hypothetical protein B0O99DRAFT_176861 [Bisporella sp. PMI_857]
MSARPQRAKLAQRTLSDSMGKHTRISHENEESLGRSGESSDLETTNKPQHFSRLEIGDFLEFDPRPTFVLDKDTNFENAPVEPVFCNAAFRSNHQLATTVIQSRSNSPSLPYPKTSPVEFRVWVKESARLEQDKSLVPPTFTYAGYVWNAFSIRERWSVFSGTVQKNRRISGSVSSRGHSPSRLSVDASRDTPLVRANSAPILKNHLETRSTEIPASTWLAPGTPDCRYSFIHRNHWDNHSPSSKGIS